MPTIPVTSREYLLIPDITATGTDGVEDPTTLTVEFAFLPAGLDPEESDWHAGGWQPDAATPTARILIGPDGVAAPPEGDYKVWLRITGTVERPTRIVGNLSIV